MAMSAIFLRFFFVFLTLVVLGRRHRFFPVRVWMAMWASVRTTDQMHAEQGTRLETHSSAKK